MAWLELRIPPLGLAVALIMAMFLADLLLPATSFGNHVFWPALVIAAAGVAVCAAGVIEFRRARTTVDPTRPDAASNLVDAGVYRWTRNPMYLGFLLLLFGVALALLNWLALVLAMLFVPYMNRWQVVPEEQALQRVFGADYAAYRTRVRRWI